MAAMQLGIIITLLYATSVSSDTNVAKGKTTYGSAQTGSYYVSRAVDGSKSTCYLSSTSNINPWWAVDLGSIKHINRVEITSWTNSYAYYLHDIMIGVTNSNPSSYHPFPGGYKVCRTHFGLIKPGATVSLNCSEDARGQYVVIQQPGRQRHMGFCEVGVYTHTTKGNVAKAQKVWESSHFNGVDLTKTAVDGSRGNKGNLKQCSQTKLEADPWWAVDLGASYAIKNVIITNRGDCCAYRLSYFVVGVTDKSPVTTSPKPGTYTVCHAHIGAIGRGSSKSINCDNVVQGRYVIVQIPGQYRILALCEVEVYIY